MFLLLFFSFFHSGPSDPSVYSDMAITSVVVYELSVWIAFDDFKTTLWQQ